MKRAIYALLWAVGMIMGMAPFQYAMGWIPANIFFHARMVLWWAIGLYCMGTSIYFGMKLLTPRTKEEWDQIDKGSAIRALLRQVGGK